MAKVKLNRSLTSVSGKIDGMVFKTFKHGVQLTKKPTFDGNWSEAQKRNREKLRRAADYANAVWADPVRKAAYEAIGRERDAWRVYPLITADFMNAPVVASIDMRSASSSGARTVTIKASDDIGVVGVAVVARAADGSTLAQGAAEETAPGRWRCVLTANWPRAGAVEIEAAAEDRPGNRTSLVRRFE